MRRFQFPLERLLWHRRRQEDQAGLAVASAVREERRLATDLARVDELASREAAALRAVLAQPATGTDLLLRARFLARLEGQEALLTERREAAIGVLRERRNVLQERRVAREVVEKLRERALAQYRKAMEREERLALDEAASVRYPRRVRPAGGERATSQGE